MANNVVRLSCKGVQRWGYGGGELHIALTGEAIGAVFGCVSYILASIRQQRLLQHGGMVHYFGNETFVATAYILHPLEPMV